MKIEYREPKDNPSFPPQITALIRFVLAERGAKRECPVCQKKARTFWTMLVPFRAASASALTMELGDILPALTAVCDAHPLQPDPALMPSIMCETVESVERAPAA